MAIGNKKEGTFQDFVITCFSTKIQNRVQRETPLSAEFGAVATHVKTPLDKFFDFFAMHCEAFLKSDAIMN